MDIIFYLKHRVSCRCLKQKNVNKIYRFVHSSQETHYVSATIPTVLDVIHRHAFYLKHDVSCRCFNKGMLIRSIGLSVPDRKHITFPLQAQQVNVIYRFFTMVY
jgi:hypothetical protein